MGGWFFCEFWCFLWLKNENSNGWKREPTPPGGTPPVEGIFQMFGKLAGAGGTPAVRRISFA
jgi:hypothetical protein